MKHINIPIFVPHAGCPHDCVFCNQKKITGKSSFDICSVKSDIETALATIDPSICETEIAFFGGSFTGIERKDMLSLLEIADKFVNEGKIRSVRCSTRPDYIDKDILDILKEHHVKTIEIGVQSTCDKVLSLSNRGHTAADIERACRLIIENGFSLVGQMMVGLPGSSLEKELSTARAICSYGASGARIYPTVVFKDTMLYELTLNNKYSPLTVNEAVKRCAQILDVFISSKVDILRVGLCENDALHNNDGIYSGAFHPSLGEMCFSEYFYLKTLKALSELELQSGMLVTVYVNSSSLSKAIGHKKMNVTRLTSLYPECKFGYRARPDLRQYELIVKAEKSL